MIIPGVREDNDLDKFVLKPAPSKIRTISTRKSHFASESSAVQTKTNNTEIYK